MDRGTTLFSEMREVHRSYDALLDAMDAFGRYVPKMLVKSLLAGAIEPELGMKEMHIAIVFMDMQNFSSMCELILPQVCRRGG